MKKLLIVFVKYPLPGMVKTRLARDMGNEQAAWLYKNTAERVLAGAAPPCLQGEYTTAIFYAPAEFELPVKQWLPRYALYFPQQGADLGERMLNAFRKGFADGYTHISIIGSDCPEVSGEIIIKSFAFLQTYDAVIGPACDGGYYLLGLQRAFSGLFTAVDWGTDKVLGQTTERMSRLNLSYSLLPKLRDIDRIEDVLYYRDKGII
ncbi:MAG: TIGR04282 family arsenosugar biosynthesis glycosyltransferase [Pseudomonadota bacterium]